MNLITEVQPLLRRDFVPAEVGLIDPLSSSPLALLDGEFLTLDGDYKASREGVSSVDTGGLLVNPAADDAAAKVPCYAHWLEKGRTDMQGIYGGRVTLLFAAGYEAEFHSDVLSPNDTFAVGDALFVNWADNGTTNDRRRVLTKESGTATGTRVPMIHGFVSRVYSVGSLYAIRAVITAP